LKNDWQITTIKGHTTVRKGCLTLALIVNGTPTFIQIYHSVQGIRCMNMVLNMYSSKILNCLGNMIDKNWVNVT
jgi:hypothetical protein